MSTSLKPILDLFKQLETTNHYTKVAGNPVFSASALLNKEVNGLKDDESLTSAEALEIVKEGLDVLRDKLAGFAWWRGQNIHGVVQELDQAALDWAHEEGYLPSAPVAVNMSPKNILRKERIPALYMEMTGEVRMISDHEGKINIDTYLQNAVAKKTDINVSVDTSKTEENPYISRLFVLFHEASHHAFSYIQSPFIAPEGFDQKAASVLNQWVFIRGAKHHSHTAFNEIFADTYGAMMLLRGLNFSQEAIDTVREFARLRIETDAIAKLTNKKSLLQRIKEHSTKEANLHVGGQTVLNMLDNMNEWKDLDLPSLKHKALQLSSEGLVKWLLPHTIDAQIDGSGWKGKTLESNRAQTLIVDKMPTFHDNITGQLQNTTLFKETREQPKHPCQKHINWAVQEVEKQSVRSVEEKSLTENGIVAVLANVLKVSKKQIFLLKEMKEDEEGPYALHEAFFKSKSDKAAKVIGQGFKDFANKQGGPTTQVVVLKGAPLK